MYRIIFNFTNSRSADPRERKTYQCLEDLAADLQERPPLFSFVIVADDYNAQGIIFGGTYSRFTNWMRSRQQQPAVEAEIPF